MRLVSIYRVPDGAQLGRDVFVGRADGIPLLRAGVRLTSAYRRGLLDAGIHAVYIEDACSEGIVPRPAVSDETRTVASRAVSNAYRAACATIGGGQPFEQRIITDLESVVDRILAEIQDADGAVLALADLSAADAYTFQHSVDVTALGLLLGRRLLEEHGWVDYKGVRQFSRFDERLTQLGLGLVLHDVGKLAIPHEVLHKPGALTAAEWEVVKTHPRAGLELLADTGISPLALSIVLRHHERWDGSGYPDGLRGEEIHEMSRIAAVADVYDAITSERVYAPAEPAHAGVRVIRDGSGRGFDPDIVEVFSRLVAPFPPGVEVELEDGRLGIVVSVPEADLDRPVVRIVFGPHGPYELDLLREPDLAIAGWQDPRARAAA
ncbi:MAG: HD-GYP domain-containing protein [Solirubrobacteraceae bacterium]|jgi:HD-GYP domain-containing protein (c-di-GMP phosphodiesterase class II)